MNAKQSSAVTLTFRELRSGSEVLLFTWGTFALPCGDASVDAMKRQGIAMGRLAMHFWLGEA